MKITVRKLQEEILTRRVTRTGTKTTFGGFAVVNLQILYLAVKFIFNVNIHILPI